ncbi:hypothetical protein DFH07DRAFT_776872 [Mycena maculata]|uniref:Uncharacterized protein n=1 Tax=Mycena maculata TaxID=230809 RepID=A0AAD7IM83_9AGAR|nr:hypothetical protein DFH07DRAFT_776872 [Mycena maculata]
MAFETLGQELGQVQPTGVVGNPAQQFNSGMQMTEGQPPLACSNWRSISLAAPGLRSWLKLEVGKLKINEAITVELVETWSSRVRNCPSFLKVAHSFCWGGSFVDMLKRKFPPLLVDAFCAAPALHHLHLIDCAATSAIAFLWTQLTSSTTERGASHRSLGILGLTSNLVDCSMLNACFYFQETHPNVTTLDYDATDIAAILETQSALETRAVGFDLLSAISCCLCNVDSLFLPRIFRVCANATCPGRVDLEGFVFDDYKDDRSALEGILDALVSALSARSDPPREIVARIKCVRITYSLGNNQDFDSVVDTFQPQFKELAAKGTNIYVGASRE